MSTPSSGFPIHPYAELFPLHDGKPMWDLRDDIKGNGQREPIILFKGKVLDGRRRQVCCLALGQKPKYDTFKGTDSEALKLVISLNLKRRHLGEAERAMVAAEIAKLTVGSNQHTGTEGASIEAPSEIQAAEMMNISRSSVQRAKKVKKKGTKKLQKQVMNGEVSLSAAAAQVDAEEETPQAITDEEGHEVPGPLKLAFDSLEKFKEIDRLLRKAQALIDEIVRLPGGEQLARHVSHHGNDDSVIYKSQHLQHLKGDLKGTRPHSACPYCWQKPTKNCNGCNGTGWVTRTTWNDASEELKEGMKK